MDKKTLAAISGVSAGTGLAYWVLHERRERQKRAENAHWKPASRFIGGFAGGALTFWGLRRGGVLGKVASGAGMTLLARSATNRRTRRLFGIIPAVADVAA